ncbi:MAG: hypothetical protein AAFQ83_23025 [Bacteroidota bacterium]
MSFVKPGVDITFSAFNEAFYAAFDDPTIFDCEEFNLLKVVQDGLKVGYNWKTPFGNSLSRIKRYYRIRQWLARFRGSKSVLEDWDLQEVKGTYRPWLILEPGRMVENEEGEKVSQYMERIMEDLGSDHFFYIQNTPLQTLSHRSFDVQLQTLYEAPYLLPISDDAAQLYEALQKAYVRIEAALGLEGESQVMVKCAFEKFWNAYRIWSFLLSNISCEKALVVCHYHKEGEIFAMKRAGLEVIELQHGLISTEDIFYVYPPKVAPVVDRALFADQIWTYGAYWEEILAQGVEYSPKQTKVIGYYHFETEDVDPEIMEKGQQAKADGQPLIFFTTQTFLHEPFIAYIQWLHADLEAKGQKAHIWVKNHPNELREAYAAIEALENVEIVTGDLKSMFRVCDYHVSIYSTTLYDALREGKQNFALYVESCADYVEAVLNSGVAQRVNMKENLLELSIDQGEAIHPEHFYATYDAGMWNTHPARTEVSTK